MGAKKAQRSKTVALSIQVVDPDGKRLDGIHIALKQGSKTVNEGFADRRGEIEFSGLITGEDYQIFVNNEEKEELVGPRGDDELEIEYEGDYVARALGDDAEESDESSDESEDDEIDDEDDTGLLGDDAEDLEI